MSFWFPAVEKMRPPLGQQSKSAAAAAATVRARKIHISEAFSEIFESNSENNSPLLSTEQKKIRVGSQDCESHIPEKYAKVFLFTYYPRYVNDVDSTVSAVYICDLKK